MFKYRIFDEKRVQRESGKEIKIISIKEAEQELPEWHFKQLVLKKQIGIRELPKKKIKKEIVIKPKVLPDDKLFEKHKSEYKMSMEPYHGKMKLGISRYNKRYGYWNFISYIESEEDFKQVVINDIKQQDKVAKQKKNKIVEDDDI